MQGSLAEHSLAELIRELRIAEVSGALRLARDRTKAVVYFERGRVVFASSNLRVHRLHEVLKRSGLASLTETIATQLSDDEVAESLLQDGQLNIETLAAFRANQVADILRSTLLWIDGEWEFDQRVRLAQKLRVQVDMPRLLLECVRHLPGDFVSERIVALKEPQFVADATATVEGLLPAEAFVLSRATTSLSLSELIALSGLGEEESVRAIYALVLVGYLQTTVWSTALKTKSRPAAKKISGATKAAQSPLAARIPDEKADVESLFTRLLTARDHYDTLGVGRLADTDEVKRAYHDLARRYHPDRFHKSEAGLRNRIESAFAQIAQAYEVLSDQSSRSAYDAKISARANQGRKSASSNTSPNGGNEPVSENVKSRAEGAFQRGMNALKANRYDEAMRLLAEAAMLCPREGRYRANYGSALSRQPGTQRMAESELKTALTLEPENASYRVMLAELYKDLGLRRRAETELEKVLIANPKHEKARNLLTSLNKR